MNDHDDQTKQQEYKDAYTKEEARNKVTIKQRSREYWPKCQTMRFLAINSINSHFPDSPTPLLTPSQYLFSFYSIHLWTISSSFSYAHILWLQFKLPKHVSKAEFLNSSFVCIPHPRKKRYHLLSWPRYNTSSASMRLFYQSLHLLMTASRLPSLTPECFSPFFILLVSQFIENANSYFDCCGHKCVCIHLHVKIQSVYLKCVWCTACQVYLNQVVTKRI